VLNYTHGGRARFENQMDTRPLLRSARTVVREHKSALSQNTDDPTELPRKEKGSSARPVSPTAGNGDRDILAANRPRPPDDRPHRFWPRAMLPPRLQFSAESPYTWNFS